MVLWKDRFSNCQSIVFYNRKSESDETKKTFNYVTAGFYFTIFNMNVQLFTGVRGVLEKF